MLSTRTIELVKSTIPLLESAGVAITEHFYQRLFRFHPELKNIFNMSNQQSGRQQFALFNAIAAYAKNIENPAVLQAAIERIAHKHTSLFVQPEHYDIVGHHLLETLQELAPDAFTPEIKAAWAEAYALLASVFIQREKDLYDTAEKSQGGWRGARRFVVIKKIKESDLVKSFILAPVDGGTLINYEPGQYLSIRVKPEAAEYIEVRQYSLSNKFDGSHYRISVKREPVPLPGVVSNYLHDHVNEGDEVEVFPPAGDFFLKSISAENVLISAGVGLTPMVSMLETILDGKNDKKVPVYFLHACETQSQHSFVNRIDYLSREYPQLKVFTWYNNENEQTNNSQFHGLMDLKAVAKDLPLPSGDFYLCGPTGFMKFIKDQLLDLGVASERIHYEVFGPHNTL
ncbi:MAG: NO-inducible flavohemoprotein [Pseudomonadota bacterium]